MFRKTIGVLLLVMAAQSAVALTRYSAAYNGFAGTALGTHVIDDDGRVVIDNTTDTVAIVPDSAAITASHYRYTARMSNSHNRAGRSYRYYSADGRRHNRSRTAAGIAVNIAPGDTTLVMLDIHDTAPFDDITGQREAIVTVTRGSNNLATWTLTEWLDMGDGLNSVAAEVIGDRLTVMVGGRQLHVVGSVSVSRSAPTVGAGVAIGSAACVSLERTVLFTTDDKNTNIDTALNATALEEHFARSNDAVEGFYDYLDRDMNEKHARLGGRYTIALVRDGDGYDIIYVGGAIVNPQEWYTGRLKGRLSLTPFNANYDLLWYDATGAEAPAESFGSLDGGSILSLHFPLFDTTMRFHRRQ